MSLILVVDDEALVAMSIADALEDAGFTVEMAHDGRSALERARSLRPAVIVTDYMMPRMDGLAMIRTLRAGGFGSDETDGWAARVPVILVSAVARRVKAEHGPLFSGYFDKPFHLAELVKAVIALDETKPDTSTPA